MDNECELSVSDVISQNYEETTRIAKREWRKIIYNLQFDYDVYHSTLLKCYETFCGQKITATYFLSYFCNAFRINAIREFQYARNKYTDDNAIDDELFKPINDSVEDDLDYDIIMKSVREKFGEELSNQYDMFICGYTLKEINEKFNISNADYTIKKVRKYISDNFS